MTKLSRFGEKDSIHPENEGSRLKQTIFEDIDPMVEYTFRVSTLVNGKTISKKLFNLKPEKNANEPSTPSILDVTNHN